MQEMIQTDDFTPLIEEDHFIDIGRCSVEGCGRRVGRGYCCVEHATEFDQRARAEYMAMREKGFVNQQQQPQWPQQQHQQPQQQQQQQQQQQYRQSRQEGTWRDERITRMREERSNKEFARQIEKKPKKISYKEQTSNRSLSEFA